MRKRLKKKLAKKNRYAHWGKPFHFPLAYGTSYTLFDPKKGWKDINPHEVNISMDLFMGLCRMGREK